MTVLILLLLCGQPAMVVTVEGQTVRHAPFSAMPVEARRGMLTLVANKKAVMIEA